MVDSEIHLRNIAGGLSTLCLLNPPARGTALNPDTPDPCDLSFLNELAANSQHPLTDDENLLRQRLHALWQDADAVIVLLGGKAGRLGESIVGTALLEGCLQLLQATGKAGTPVHILVDAKVEELFPPSDYRTIYWPEIHVSPLKTTAAPLEIIGQYSMPEKARHVLVLDCHGTNDGMPYLQLYSPAEESQQPSQRTTFAIAGQLFRMGIRDYAQRGPVSRYADFLTDFFMFPAQLLDGKKVQPRLYPIDQDAQRYHQLATELQLDPEALPIIGFFQSVVLAKCYELWDEVMQRLSEYVALHFPQQKLEFILPCGPDEDLPDNFKMADIADWLQDFRGAAQNSRVVIYRTTTLRDLLVLTHKAALALSDDTGPGHIAGALQIPTITAYLPGTLYSQQVWSSTLYHHGISPRQEDYSNQQVKSAILWGNTDIINSITPELLYQQTLHYLPSHLQTS